MRIPTRIPTTAQLRELEKEYIEACGQDWGTVLMEVAGRAAAEAAIGMLDNNEDGVAIVCGSGNNGGDGMVAARYLHLSGFPVRVVKVGSGSRDSVSREAAVNAKILRQLGVAIEELDGDDPQIITDVLSGAVLIVDALFGTGLSRAVEGKYLAVINAINDSGKPVLSIDVPSGIHSDSGQIMGAAVNAHSTVTFGYLKPGLLHYPAAAHVGDLTLIDIGLPNLPVTADGDKADASSPPNIFLTTVELVQSLLPHRKLDSNKGDYGTVLSIAGSAGMSGAALLASRTSLRTGAGLTLLATPKSLIDQLPPGEVIYRGLAFTEENTISASAIKDVEPLLEKATALILGPGLTTHQDTVKFVGKLLKMIDKPCLIDADGLNSIALDTSIFPLTGANFVLTPHPKELSRLMGVETKEIQSDRVKWGLAAADKFGCTVVLKGARTVVANWRREVFINTTGSAGMSTAGAGDVLSGIIGGLLSQGMEPYLAAVCGVYLHGVAGELACAELGDAGIIAGDITENVPIAIAKILSGEYLGSVFELTLTGAVVA